MSTDRDGRCRCRTSRRRYLRGPVLPAHGARRGDHRDGRVPRRDLRGRELAQRLRTGIVDVNDQTLNDDAYAPFGGTGASGNGARFGSQSSWDEFTQWQWLTYRETPHPFPF
jgi:hypothetical protein